MRRAVSVSPVHKATLRVMLALPVALVFVVVSTAGQGMLAPVVASILVALCAIAFLVLWRAWIGKYAVLTLRLVAWVCLPDVVLSATAGLIGHLAAGTLVSGLTVLAFHVVVPWSAARATGFKRQGRGRQEREWAHPPRSYVRQHGWYKLSVGIYLTAAAVIASAALVSFIPPWSAAPVWASVIFAAVTVFFLFAKGAVPRLWFMSGCPPICLLRFRFVLLDRRCAAQSDLSPQV